MADDEIFVYALSTCPWCRKTKEFFKQNQVPFEFVEVDQLSGPEEEEASQKAFELSGGRRFPVTVINGEVVTGYRPERFLELMKKGGM